MNIYDFFLPKSKTFYLEDNATIRQALEKFDYHKFSVVPVIDQDGKFITTISEGDILRFIKNDSHFSQNKAEDVRVIDIEKYRPYKALNINDGFDEIIKLSLDQNFVPLIDDRGIFMGILKRKSILEYLINKDR